MTSVAGDLTSLPFANGSVGSLSCLHVAEHVGLGRYGDRLDPLERVKRLVNWRACSRSEGRSFSDYRWAWNGRASTRTAYMRRTRFASISDGLELVEFSGVLDDGRFVERASLADFADEAYACGMYWFRKPERA